MNANDLWKWFKTVGTLAIAIAVVGLAIGGFAIGPGFNALGNLIEAAAHKDAAAMASVIALLNLALTTSAVMFLVLKYAATQASLNGFAATAKTNSLAVAELKTVIGQLLSHLKYGSGKVFFDDLPEIWSVFVGNLFLARNPTFALEVRWAYLAGNSGQWRLFSDPQRVLVWRQRLSAEGPAQIEIIFKVGAGTFSPGRNLSATAVDNIIRFLFLLRQVRREDPSVNLRKITVYLVAVKRTHQSVFIGERRGPLGRERIGITYAGSRDPLADRGAAGASQGSMPNDPRPLIITTDEDLIGRWTKECEEFQSAAQMVLTIEQLEMLYGHLVPKDEAQVMSRLNYRDWRPNTDRLRTAAALLVDDGGVVDRADGSFIIDRGREASSSRLDKTG